MPTLTHLIEELSINAYPALHGLHYDGWLLRFAGGFTRRANSVHVLADSCLPLDEKIAYCEEAYASHHLPTVFKLTGDPDAAPSDLERALIDRGYDIDRPGITTVRICDALPAESPSARTQIDDALTDDWLEAYAALNEVPPHRAAIKRAMMKRMILPAGYARLTDAQGAISAVALGVLERGWIGIYGVVVAADQRGHGLGSQLMRDLLAWGRAQGAQRSYLQMLHNNSAARRVYDRLGYYEIYRYWYRQRG